MGSNNDKLTYFLVGSFVGAAVALLFAPRSGEETREFIGTKYREGSEKINQKTQDSRESLKAKSEWLAEKAREGRETVVVKSRDLADKVNTGIDKSKENLTRQKQQIADAVEAGRQAYQEGKEAIKSPADADPGE